MQGGTTREGLVNDVFTKNFNGVFAQPWRKICFTDEIYSRREPINLGSVPTCFTCKWKLSFLWKCTSMSNSFY